MPDTIAASSKSERKTRSGKETEPEKLKGKVRSIFGNCDLCANSQQKRKVAVVVHQNEEDDAFQDDNETAETPMKKRRGEVDEKQDQGKGLETSKPSALFKPREGRKWTVSMAVPGSIIAK